jgi:hypothetical protein
MELPLKIINNLMDVRGYWYWPLYENEKRAGEQWPLIVTSGQPGYWRFFLKNRVQVVRHVQYCYCRFLEARPGPDGPPAINDDLQ